MVVGKVQKDVFRHLEKLNVKKNTKYFIVTN